MEGEDAGGLAVEGVVVAGGGHVFVYAFVLAVILRCDFCEESGYHFDYVGYGHCADFVLLAF